MRFGEGSRRDAATPSFVLALIRATPMCVIWVTDPGAHSPAQKGAVCVVFQLRVLLSTVRYIECQFLSLEPAAIESWHHRQSQRLEIPVGAALRAPDHVVVVPTTHTKIVRITLGG